MAQVGIAELLEAGVHFGHQTRRWNPKMRRFIHGERGGIYIIDLLKTAVLLEQAREFAGTLAHRGGTVLFVGTKKQARDTVRDVATAAGMPYVNHRWLGGLLTNFQTINLRIRRLHDLERFEAEGQLALLPTRERMARQADLAKLRANLGGVKDMQRVPDAMFVIDLKTEAIAVREAQRLRIPIIGLVDTNCDPDGIDFVVPGNDDAIRSCSLITRAIGDVVAEGRNVFRAEEERARQEAEERARDRGRGARQARSRGRRRPPRGRGAGRAAGPGTPRRAAGGCRCCRGGRGRAAAPEACARPAPRRPQRTSSAKAAPSSRRGASRRRRPPVGSEAAQAEAAPQLPPEAPSRRPRRPLRSGAAYGAGARRATPGRARRRGGAACAGRCPEAPERAADRRRSKPQPDGDAAAVADPRGGQHSMNAVEISAKDVKALRDRTGAGMMDCKKALTEAAGDLEKAIEILRLRQGKKIQDLGERTATEGTVQSYIHPGAKVGVLIEVDCNTDFVATNEDFTGFARDVAMQIAACPTVAYVSREDVPAERARRGGPHLRAGGGRQAGERARANRRRQARRVVQDDRAARAGAAQPQVRGQDRPAAARRAHREDRRERGDPPLRRFAVGQ